MQVRRVESKADLEKCRKFWYQIYVLGMKRHIDDPLHTNHDKKSLRDGNDEAGNLFAVFLDDSVVGTLLSTHYRKTRSFGCYDDLYQLARQPVAFREKTSITNKLMLAPQFRGTDLAIRLCLANNINERKHGIEHVYVDCNSYLIPFFERLGFVEHLGWIVHKDYGKTWSMVGNVVSAY